MRNNALVRTTEQIEPGDRGTYGSTIPWMQRLVQEGRLSPLVCHRAARIAASSPHLHPADAVFRHVQSMPYRLDEDTAALRGYGEDVSEVLHGAPYQVGLELREGASAVHGDCDCRAILFQSLVEALGYKTRFVFVRGPGRSDVSHVYSEVLTEAGWKPADTIMDGNDGRPRLGFGEEVGPPLATGRHTVDVSGDPWLFASLVAAFVLWRALR